MMVVIMRGELRINILYREIQTSRDKRAASLFSYNAGKHSIIFIV